jgi:hypothetical protein
LKPPTSKCTPWIYLTAEKKDVNHIHPWKPRGCDNVKIGPCYEDGIHDEGILLTGTIPIIQLLYHLHLSES